jgi:hypothetical protein
MDIAMDESDGLFAPRIGPNPAFEAHDAEVPPSRGEICIGDLADWSGGTHEPIIEGAVIRFGYERSRSTFRRAERN